MFSSYLHFSNCHHPRLISNIPKSQFCRLRHNCTRSEDYIEQGDLFKQTFLEKGYPSSLVQEACTHYLNETPLTNSHHPVPSQTTRFVTQFHTQHKKMEHILRKHWGILLEDPYLQPSLSNKPTITYRKAKNIKSQIAPSKLKPNRTQLKPTLTFLNIKGMYQCRKLGCLTCKFVKHRQKQFTTKGKTYHLGEFYNCSTEFVIYFLTFPCGLLYIGRTIRTLQKRFGEHRRSIENDNDLTIPRHFAKFHQGSTDGL